MIKFIFQNPFLLNVAISFSVFVIIIFALFHWHCHVCNIAIFEVNQTQAQEICTGMGQESRLIEVLFSATIALDIVIVGT